MPEGNIIRKIQRGVPETKIEGDSLTSTLSIAYDPKCKNQVAETIAQCQVALGFTYEVTVANPDDSEVQVTVSRPLTSEEGILFAACGQADLSTPEGLVKHTNETDKLRQLYASVHSDLALQFSRLDYLNRGSAADRTP